MTRAIRSGELEQLFPDVQSRVPLELRFWSKVVRAGDCFLFTGGKAGNGYGVFSIRKPITQYAHRFAWETTKGPIPDGMNVLHRCDNPSCVNPDHLFIGTQRDNVRDMDVKNRRRFKSKLSITEVEEIRRKYATSEYTLEALGREYDISFQHVWQIIKRLRWKGNS